MFNHFQPFLHLLDLWSSHHVESLCFLAHLTPSQSSTQHIVLIPLGALDCADDAQLTWGVCVSGVTVVASSLTTSGSMSDPTKATRSDRSQFTSHARGDD